MRTALTTLIALTLLVAARADDPTQPKGEPEAVKNAKETLTQHLAKIGGQGAQILGIQDEGLQRSFPKHVFLTARFRIYPIARDLPEGMQAANVFVFDGKKLQHLKDSKQLEAFFKEQLPKAGANKAGENAVIAWLALAQEFHQDGLFKFEIERKQMIAGNSSNGQELVGTHARVAQGGNGSLQATLHFDAEGKLMRVVEKAAIRPGPRPICQATLLLDPNPLVRRICEQDLLIMGLAARDYLMEQRQRATPELRREIDRVWRQIQQNGW